MSTETATEARRIVEKLSKHYKAMKRDSGETYFIVDLPQDDEAKETLLKSHPEEFAQMDDWYELIGSVLDQLQVEEWATEEEAHEVVADQEPDIYNYDLCAWLGRSLNYIEYVDQAMSEYGATDTTTALRIGQQLQFEAWAHQFVDALFEHAAKKQEAAA